VYPAGKRDSLAGVFATKFSAGVSSMHCDPIR
jgi:hypothetical protein